MPEDVTAAMCFAFRQSGGIECTGCRGRNNGSGSGFERTTGTVLLTRPVADRDR